MMFSKSKLGNGPKRLVLNYASLTVFVAGSSLAAWTLMPKAVRAEQAESRFLRCSTQVQRAGSLDQDVWQSDDGVYLGPPADRGPEYDQYISSIQQKLVEILLSQGIRDDDKARSPTGKPDVLCREGTSQHLAAYAPRDTRKIAVNPGLNTFRWFDMSLPSDWTRAAKGVGIRGGTVARPKSQSTIAPPQPSAREKAIEAEVKLLGAHRRAEAERLVDMRLKAEEARQRTLGKPVAQPAKPAQCFSKGGPYTQEFVDHMSRVESTRMSYMRGPICSLGSSPGPVISNTMTCSQSKRSKSWRECKIIYYCKPIPIECGAKKGRSG